MDRSELKQYKIAEKCVVSYAELDFETEKFHQNWAWGDAKSFKSLFLETISSTDLKLVSFIAK